jgi:hypothetical protein
MARPGSPRRELRRGPVPLGSQAAGPDGRVAIRIHGQRVPRRETRRLPRSCAALHLTAFRSTASPANASGRVPFAVLFPQTLPRTPASTNSGDPKCPRLSRWRSGEPLLSLCAPAAAYWPRAPSGKFIGERTRSTPHPSPLCLAVSRRSDMISLACGG